MKSRPENFDFNGNIFCRRYATIYEGMYFIGLDLFWALASVTLTSNPIGEEKKKERLPWKELPNLVACGFPFSFKGPSGQSSWNDFPLNHRKWGNRMDHRSKSILRSSAHGWSPLWRANSSHDSNSRPSRRQENWRTIVNTDSKSI